MEGLDSWAEIAWNPGLSSIAKLMPPSAIGLATLGQNPPLVKCMGGYGDKTETASQAGSPDNAAKLTQ